jgi:hypothetical protein
MGMFIDTLNFVATAQNPVHGPGAGIALSSIGPKSIVRERKRDRRTAPVRYALSAGNHPATVQAVSGILAIFGGGRAA